MRIAFYAPLKSPHHPVPSGDRQMARLLIAALRLAGHEVEVASELRSFSISPDKAVRDAIAASAQVEIQRLCELWRGGERPDLWFCYHPYYKAPDLIGPELSAALAIPYITAEASYSKRRDDTAWAESQSSVVDAIRQAAVNICFTERDRTGIEQHIAGARLVRLQPFIDVSAFREIPVMDQRSRLVTVAMMRPGDKLESYRVLAEALVLLGDKPWSLGVIGDGPIRDEVKRMFSGFSDRIEWLGEKTASEVVELLCGGGTYVWPGMGEAYGIAYLEAQAAGLPVVAFATAGVPEVVKDGCTGMLTPAGNVPAFADAIVQLLDDDKRRIAMGKAARRFVLEERSLEVASIRLEQLLKEYAQS